MKRTVWTFGLIAGGIMALMMVLTMPFQEKIGTGNALVVGYTSMILAFLMVYFGIRAYRDNELAGVIRFGRAFKVGILIALIASTCYVGTWEVLYHTAYKGFEVTYAQSATDQARKAGKSDAEIQKLQASMASFVANYPSPFYRIPMTYLEVLPVGLVMVLVCSGILSRKRA